MSEVSQSEDLTMEGVFARYYGEMVGYTRKALRAAEVPESFTDAEDVVQNAFMKAYRVPERVTQPRAYLYKIIKNEVKDHSDRARRSRLHVPTCPPVPAPDCAEAVTEVCDVRQALRILPQRGRAAVWATKGLGFSQAEYAQAEGVPPGTVASLVARAVPLLKTALTVATAVAAVLGCAVGALTIRGYSQATPAGRPLPNPLEDAPRAVSVAMGAFVVIYVCLALMAGLATTALAAPRLLSNILQWLRRRGVPPSPSEPTVMRGPNYCHTCKKNTESRDLTGEERSLFWEIAHVYDVPMRICVDCSREVDYEHHQTGMGASLTLPAQGESVVTEAASS